MVVKYPASVEVPGSARPDLGLGPIRRCGHPVGPVLSVHGHQTIYEIFEASALKYPKNPCIGHRPIAKDGTAGDYVWQTYEQVFERSHNFGSGLVNFSLCNPNSDGLKLLGFYAKNRPEYVVGDMGCYSRGIVPVPMYDALDPDGLDYAVKLTEMQTIFCTSEVLMNCIEVAKRGSGLCNAILMDSSTMSKAELEKAKSDAQAGGLTVYTMEEVEASGKNNRTPLTLPKGDDIAFFCFTSGTTGDAKAAIVLHRGPISCLASVMPLGMDMYPDDVHLCYLPLPHVFERAIMLSVFYGGGRIGFYQGDTLKILEDIQALRPTIFPSVPRLLNRVYDKVIAGVEEAGGVKKWLFEKALASKVDGLRHGSYTHPIWDRLVFGPLKKRLGFDRLRLAMTGSAPIAGHVLDFLRAMWGCPVQEGYGQTESSLLISSTLIDDTTTGHVGVPAPCNEIRLIDVPDMGYTSADREHNDGTKCVGRGEICFRGPNVFREYYHMEEKTRETVDEDGWCHTGDIGLWTEEGKLRIIDRKKNIFKLAQGEYVAAEKIENVIARSPLILQSFVYGDSLETFLLAAIVPDPEGLANNGLKEDDPNLKEKLLKALQQECRNAQLKGFEIPKAIILTEEFTVQNGLLTPTFKLKRPQAKDKFEKEFTDLYAQVKAQSKL